jgi:histone acetyltransferase (RNA polymerase elongator complex component)
MQFYNIPVFIPGLACPFQCIFCDQQKISSQHSIPSPADVHEIVKQHLSTIPETDSYVEIGFFGGNFTGLPQDIQHQYLLAASYWVNDGKIDGIRLSTRPDNIDDEAISLLKQYPVSCVELGAQSLDDTVLKLSERGHNSAQVVEASKLIRQAGFKLGLQMMIGLPGDSASKNLMTAMGISELGADNTRIYPTLVIKGTPLHDLYKKGDYVPISMEEAIERASILVDFFENHNITILRVGLHPSHEMNLDGNLVAGPWHPAFRELVLSHLWAKALKPLTEYPVLSEICIFVAEKQLNCAIGHKAMNKKMLQEHYKKVIFKTDPHLKGRNFYVDNS